MKLKPPSKLLKSYELHAVAVGYDQCTKDFLKIHKVYVEDYAMIELFFKSVIHINDVLSNLDSKYAYLNDSIIEEDFIHH